MSRTARPKLIVLVAMACQLSLACESAPAHPLSELRDGELPLEFVGQTLLTDRPVETRMFAPPHRSSIDGRVAVYACAEHELCFDVLAPEIFSDSELPISLRIGLLAADQPVQLNVAENFGVVGSIRDPVLCEGHWGEAESDCDPSAYGPQSNSCHGRFYEWSDSQNPFVHVEGDPDRSRCTQAPGHECYDLTLMFVQEGETVNDVDQLKSVRVLVTVGEAKTADAHVASVEVLEETPTEVAFAPQSAIDHTDIRSPSVTGDGRLLVMSSGSEGLVYAYNRETPCSPAGWNAATVKRISRMREDGDMFGVVPDNGPKAYPRYGLAAVGFRDPNRPANPDARPHPIVPIGAPIHGGAVWVDRRGSNLLFAAAHAPVYDATRVSLELHANGLLDETWVADNCGESFAELVTVEGEYNVGAAIMGLWTDGKVVMLDGGINLSDLAIDFTRLEQCIETHAEPQDRAELEAKLGILVNGAVQGDEVQYYVTTEQFENESSITAVGETAIHTLASLENRLHHQASARPALPRNLTALVSNDRSTHELAFDDTTNVNTLVIANMMPSLEVDPSAGAPHRIIDSERIQNEAQWRQHSRSRLEPPHHGELIGSPPPHVEPYARGGVHGRGVYLSGSNGVSFNLRVPVTNPPSAPPRPNQPVQLSMWIKPDDVTQGRPDQQLLATPDGTIVTLVTPNDGSQSIRISKLDQNNQVVSETFTIPSNLPLAAGKWSHIGFFANTSTCPEEVTALAQSNGPDYEIERGDSIVEFFVDGTLVRRIEQLRDSEPDDDDPDSCPQATEPLATPRYFRLAEGELVVGTATTQGFAGWVDELRLTSMYPSSQNYEEICNLAYGTLMQSPTGQGWESIDAGFHAPVRADIQAKTGEEPDTQLRFICDVREPESVDLPWLLRDPRFDVVSAGQCIGRVEVGASPPALARDLDPACVDEQLLYPEGPLTVWQPRPDSFGQNRTCVNCHINAPTLSETMYGLPALGPEPLMACEDRRRREGQAPARMFGRTPTELDDCKPALEGPWYAIDGCFQDPVPPAPPPAPPKTCPSGGDTPKAPDTP